MYVSMHTTYYVLQSQRHNHNQMWLAKCDNSHLLYNIAWEQKQVVQIVNGFAESIVIDWWYFSYLLFLLCSWYLIMCIFLFLGKPKTGFELFYSWLLNQCQEKWISRYTYFFHRYSEKLFFKFGPLLLEGHILELGLGFCYSITWWLAS